MTHEKFIRDVLSLDRKIISASRFAGEGCWGRISKTDIRKNVEDVSKYVRERDQLIYDHPDFDPPKSEMKLFNKAYEAEELDPALEFGLRY